MSTKQSPGLCATRWPRALVLAVAVSGCAFRTVPPLYAPSGMPRDEQFDHAHACGRYAVDRTTYRGPVLADALAGGMLAAALGAATGAAVGAAVGGQAAYGAKIGAAANGPAGFAYGAATSYREIPRPRLANKVYYHCMLRAGFREGP